MFHAQQPAPAKSQAQASGTFPLEAHPRAPTAIKNIRTNLDHLKIKAEAVQGIYSAYIWQSLYRPARLSQPVYRQFGGNVFKVTFKVGSKNRPRSDKKLLDQQIQP